MISFNKIHNVFKFHKSLKLFIDNKAVFQLFRLVVFIRIIIFV